MSYQKLLSYVTRMTEAIKHRIPFGTRAIYARSPDASQRVSIHASFTLLSHDSTSCRQCHHSAMNDSSPQIPTSFDPALFLHSEAEPPIGTLTSFAHSDELDALQQCVVDNRTQQTQQGVVIQHRSWRTTEAFRSEDDYPIGTTTRTARAKPPANSAQIHLSGHRRTRLPSASLPALPPTANSPPRRLA
jgi:hypothetical protein